MFTGIIEQNSPILQVTPMDQALQIVVKRPENFDDLKIGDSIACNGVCLTVEAFDDTTMTFTIGFETLQITGWKAQRLEGLNLNLERSLRFGDRIHGHLVSGHVDATTELKNKEKAGECLLLDFTLPEKIKKQVWDKSSIAINGVSLTVNWIKDGVFQVCLVPETLRKTNFPDMPVGETVNLETDYYMKGLLQSQGALNA